MTVKERQETKDRPNEPALVARVRQTHRVSLRANYSAPDGGGRITVSRAEGGGQRLTVNWNHSLDVGENYALAFNEFIRRMNWGGSWVIGSTNRGYVAVCDDPAYGKGGK
jgi:hypothetical protein